MCRFGAQAVVHTDQGRNFQSHQVLRLLDVTQTRTCAFRLQSDGMVKRSNCTLEQLVATVIEKEQANWETQLPMAMAAYRSSRHETTGVTRT